MNLTLIIELNQYLDYKEIQPVHSKEISPEYSLEGLVLKLKLILWPPDAKNWLTRKDPDAGKDWRQEKGTTEDEMVGWHHWVNGHEFEWTLGGWWWTRRPGVLRFMGSQRVGHDWATELNWTEPNICRIFLWNWNIWNWYKITEIVNNPSFFPLAF